MLLNCDVASKYSFATAFGSLLNAKIYKVSFQETHLHNQAHKSKSIPFIVSVNMSRKIRTRISIVPSNAFVFFSLVLLDLAP